MLDLEIGVIESDTVKKRGVCLLGHVHLMERIW